MVHVTAFFAGLLAFIYIGLSVNVIRKRYSLRLALGDGGDADMIRRIRAHNNFAEYVPLALILMGLDELNGTYHGVLVLCGIILALGRLSHAYSLTTAETKRHTFRFRMAGMISTFSVIALLAIIAVF